MSKVAHLTSPRGRVRVYEPSGNGVYYRLKYQDEFNKPRQTHATRDLLTALLRAEDIERRLLANSAHAQHATLLRHLVEGYLDPQRDKFRSRPGRSSWSDGYTSAVKRRLSLVTAEGGDVRLFSLSAAHVSALLAKCATESAARALRNTLRAMVVFGVNAGYLRADQARVWDVDLPSFGQGQPTTQVPFAPTVHLAASRVPTVASVCRLADATTGYPLWHGLVYTTAGAGLRIHELLALRATDIIATDDGVVLLVERQLTELQGGGIRFDPPKNGYARLVPIADLLFDRFPLADWLLDRAADAEAERACGRNSDAVLFPTARGKYWRLRNLRSRLFVPAAEEAGWAFTTVSTPVTTAKGRAKVLRRRCWVHTIHSLRHRFAATAIDEWRWSSAELTAAGGWASLAVVHAHYYGPSDDVVDSARRKQRASRSLGEVTEHA